MTKSGLNFKAREYRRQAAFRRSSATISSNGRIPVDENGRKYDYMLALGHEDENLYPSLRGASGVRRFFDERAITWWRHSGFDETKRNGPTRNMASSQIACVNFVLPLAGFDNGLLALIETIDKDVTGIVTIKDSKTRTSSPVEFEWIGLDHALEGEADTTRGEFATSVDAFLVAETRSGRRAYLLEWKYTESYRANDKGRGSKGETRRQRYGKLYAASPAVRDGIALDGWLHEPFYQVMRQRLLADRMIARKELGVSEAKVVLVVPDENTDYRENINSPALGEMFPNATTVEEVTRAAMNVPDRDFAVVNQHEIGEVIRARCGEAARHWSEYQHDRYGW